MSTLTRKDVTAMFGELDVVVIATTADEAR